MVLGGRQVRQTLAPIVCLAIGGIVVLSDVEVSAQLVPDATLGNENSRVTPLGEAMRRIDGGAIRGENLFHSFQEFNVGDLQTVHFANPNGIQRILTRVTGGNQSEILGTLGVFGNADLFLINPNGISFGANATLDVNGSFVASTADSLVFEDVQFSATNTGVNPILSMGVPLGLQYGSNSDSIMNVSRSMGMQSPMEMPGTLNSVGLPVGLRVPDGKTLALVGGNITLEGLNLSAFSGRVELGSVVSPDTVSLTPVENGWTLGYDGVERFGDIHLSQELVVDVSGFSVSIVPPNMPGEEPVIQPQLALGGAGGTVQVQGNDITLSNAAITSETVGPIAGRNITINAENSLDLNGQVVIPSQQESLPAGLFAQTSGEGHGGNLLINTNVLEVRDRAQILTGTRGIGNSGNLIVNATEVIEIKQPLSGLSTQTIGSGQSGRLEINTERLIVDRGQISTTTFSSGDAGDLAIRASELVEVRGEFQPQNADRVFSGGLFTQVEVPSDMNGMLSPPPATGSGGTLTVETDRLIVENGGQISASTTSEGSGGTLNITASEIELRGQRSDNMSSGLFTITRGPNRAGNLTIDTDRLIIEDGATVSVRGERSPMPMNPPDEEIGEIGDAGNLRIHSDDIRLNRNAVISAATLSGNGGNINIDTATIAGFNNSDISANAGGGQGGVIEITAEGVFGLEERDREDVPTNEERNEFQPQLLPSNDITALSVADPTLDGQIIFNTPDVDLTQEVFERENPIAPEDQVARGCEASVGEEASWYIETGAGGLSPIPGESLSGSAIWQDERSPRSGNATTANSQQQANSDATGRIVEAGGWIWKDDARNTVVFTHASSDAVPEGLRQTPPECHGR
jgi:filamentous hemagglutinin family protein